MLLTVDVLEVDVLGARRFFQTSKALLAFKSQPIKESVWLRLLYRNIISLSRSQSDHI